MPAKRQPLACYAEAEATTFDITQTRTGQLCEALEVAEPEPECIVRHDEQGQVVTNYAEHVDAVLWRSDFGSRYRLL